MAKVSVGVWVLIAAPFALFGYGCSSKFSGCEDARTCPADQAVAGAGGNGNAGASATANNGGSSGSGSHPAEAGQAGAKDEPSMAGQAGRDTGMTQQNEAGQAGVGGEAAMGGCSKDSDCDDGKPENGAETCVARACQPGDPPPTVASVLPADDATEVEPDATPSITFSKKFDATTVTASTVSVLDGTQQVPGALSLASSGLSARYTPSANLDLLTKYTISVDTGVKDEAGTNLLEKFSSSFTVRDGAWQPAKSLSDPDAPLAALDPLIATDGSGNVLVVLVQSDDSTISARWYRNGKWENPVRLDNNSDVEQRIHVPALAVDAKGDAIVAFSVNGVGMVARQYRNGAWDTGGQIFDGEPAFLSVGISPLGEAHVVYSYLSGNAKSMEARHSDASGNWLPSADTIASELPGSNVVIAFDADGSAIATWSSNADSPSIRVARFQSPHWGSATTLAGSTSSANFSPGDPTVATDTDGSAVIAWVRQTDTAASAIEASMLSKGGEWGPPVAVQTASGFSGSLEAPGLVFDGNDFVLAWNQLDGATSSTHQSRAKVSGTWKSATPAAHASIVPMDGMPHLGSDGHGNLLITWLTADAEGNVAADLMFSRYVSASSQWSTVAKAAANPFYGGVAELSVSQNGTAAAAFANRDPGLDTPGVFVAAFR